MVLDRATGYTSNQNKKALCVLLQKIRKRVNTTVVKSYSEETPYVEYSIYYNKTYRYYQVDAIHIAVCKSDSGFESVRTTLDFKRRSIGLVPVARKTPKVEKALTKWLEDNIDGIRRSFTFLTDDNMYQFKQYVYSHPCEVMKLNAFNNEFESTLFSLAEYEVLTDAWVDFGLCGTDIINIDDKFSFYFENSKKDYKQMVELSLVLNHRLHLNYEKSKRPSFNDEQKSLYDAAARKYDELWKQVDEWCCVNLHGEAAEYHYRITD